MESLIIHVVSSSLYSNVSINMVKRFRTAAIEVSYTVFSFLLLGGLMKQLLYVAFG